jgi:hypothetical protein
LVAPAGATAPRQVKVTAPFTVIAASAMFLVIEVHVKVGVVDEEAEGEGLDSHGGLILVLEAVCWFDPH